MKRKLIYGVIISVLVLIVALGMFTACNGVDDETECSISFIDATSGTEQIVKTLKVESGHILKASEMPAGNVYEGKRFVGWFFADGSTQLSAGFKVTANSTKVFAKYEDETPEVTTHTVTFDLGDYDGAEAAPSARTVEDGGSIILPAVGVIWEEHTFTGWKAAGVLYSVGASYVVRGDVTFVAQWTQDLPTTYTATFDLGIYAGDEAAPAPRTVDAGENVTLPGVGVTWAGYEFLGWKVENDSNIYLAGNEYRMNDNVVFTAQWKDLLIDGVLTSLRGNVQFEGTMNERFDDGDVLPSTIHALYDADLNLIERYELFEDSVYDYLLVRGANNDNVYTPFHDLSGKVKWTLPTNSDGETLRIPYSEVANPFETLTDADFTKLSDTAYTVALDKASDIVFALTGYSLTIEKFEIQLNDGVASKIVFRSASQSYSGLTYYDEGELIVTGDVALSEELVTDYPDQPLLNAALEKAAAATAYTVTQTDGDVSGKIYRTDDVIWADFAADSYGYIVRPDGNAWRFSFDGESMVMASSPAAADMDLLAAQFVSPYISTAMYTLSEDKYVLRQADINGIYGDVLRAQSALAFATGVEQQNLFAGYAVSIAITLSSDGDLEKVEVSYPAVVSGQLTLKTMALEFGDFDSTQLPETLVLDQDVVKGKFAVDYVGTWIDDESGLRTVISLDSAVINGLVSGIVTKTEAGTYTVKIGGLEYNISLENDDLLLNDGAKQYTLRRRECDWEDFIGSYHTYGGDDEISINISRTGITIVLNGAQGTLDASNIVVSEDGDDEVIEFLYSDDEYGLQDAYITLLTKNKAVNFAVTYGEDAWLINVNLYIDGYDFGDWEQFEGVYHSDKDESLTITSTSIEIVYDNETLTFGLSDILFEAVEYIAPIFTLKKGTTVYSLQQYGGTSGKLALYISSEGDSDADRVAIFVKDNYQHADWAVYVGKFVGVESEGNGYSVTIKEDGLSLKMDGTEYEASSVDFDKYLYSDATGATMWLYRFDFTISGKQYSLRQMSEGDVYILQLYQVNELNNLPICKLARDDQAQQEDWSAFVGTYSWDDYSVEISEDGISVTLDGQPAAIASYTFYSSEDHVNSSTFYAFDFVVGDVTYTLRFIDTDAAILSAENLKLMLTTGTYSFESDFSAWEGYYATDDNNIKIKITSDSVSFALDKADLTAVNVIYFVAEGDMVIEADGKQYFLTFTKAQITYIEKDKITVMYNNSELGVAEKTNEPETGAAWAKFAGIYTGIGADDDLNYTVVISNSGITLAIGSGPAIAATNISVSYDPTWEENDIKFTVNDISYTLEIYDNGNISLKPARANMHKEDLPEQESAWAKFAGTYKGSSVDNSYTVVVTNSGITLSVDNGPAVEATDISLSYDSGWGENDLKFTVNGTVYTLEIYDKGGISLNVSGGGKANMTKEELPEQEAVWARFAGTYKGSSMDYSYTVVVTNSGITLSIDNRSAVEATDISVSHSSDTWGAYTALKFTVDGKEYTLEIYDDEGFGISLSAPGENRSIEMHKA